VTDPADAKPAGGLEAAAIALSRATRELGVRRAAAALGALNQRHGFDCPSCAWPDPEHRSVAEFCENGAKAVAHEATRKRIGAAFFAEWPVEKLLAQSDHWL
jgi:hypothetical protein